MAAPGVAVERTFRAPRALVWALLADTNRYDRALGLSIPRYTWKEIDGKRQLVGEAKQGGMALSWIEEPYQWVEGRFLEGGRRFLSGPAADGGLRIDVSDDDEGCTARVEARGEAKSWALKVLSPLVTGALRRRLRAYVDDVASMVEDEVRVSRLYGETGQLPPATRVQELVFEQEGSSLAGYVTPIDTAELARGKRRLEAAPVDPDVADQLIRFLSTRPDDEVAQIRAFELARAWDLPRREVLRGFLHATRAGLVDLNWQINCPVCRVSADVVTSLADVGRDVHCDSCNIRYSVAFGDDVEAVFRCNAAVRAVQPSVYCASSPTFRPHVLAQLRVDPGKTRTESIDLGCRHVRVRTLGKHAPGLFEGEQPPARLLVSVSDDAVTVESEGAVEEGTPTEVELTSTGSEPVYVLLERAGWSADAVLGSVIASMSEFIDLFATEAPAAGLELSISRLTLLFSDLTGSTALYTRIGDARAFAVVQEHFGQLGAAITEHGGALVKTMGDAVMATFDSVPDAIRAAVEAVRVTRAKHGELDVGVKLGIHEGPCLAVRANDRIDFFGTTVNTAARLQGRAGASELVLEREVAERDDVAALLEGLPRREFEADLKGIEGARRLVGFDLSEATATTPARE